MRFERLVDKLPAGSPQTRSPASTQIALSVVTSFVLLANLALWTLAWAPEGLQHLLLLCLVRLAVLTCVGAASYHSLARRRSDAAHLGSARSGTLSSSSALLAALPAPASASPRTPLTHAAVCLQLTWLATELVLSSSLLVFHPVLLGPGVDYPASAAALLSVLPLACSAAMSGCFLFFQRLTGRRRRASRAGASPPTLECGLGLAPGHASHAVHHYHHMHTGAYGAVASALPERGSAAPHSTSSLDGAASPLSDCGSYSTCSSASASYPYSYPLDSAGSSVLSLSPGSSSGGAPSPTGHVRGGAPAAAHEAAIQAACEILLVEHQLDTHEYCLFVHKRLRPIRTRPEDKSRPAPAQDKPGLLRELITNSFTFQHDTELRAQLAASMAVTSAGGASSGASSITFQQATAAAGAMQVM